MCLKTFIVFTGLILFFKTALTYADDGISFTNFNCRLQGDYSESLQDSKAWARVTIVEDGTNRRTENMDNSIVCDLKDESGSKQIDLEIVLERDPPTAISLHSANLYLPALQSSTISCMYGDIGAMSKLQNTLHDEIQEIMRDDEIEENGIYQCGDAEHEFVIVFNGIFRSTSPPAHERTKRSDEVESCARFSKKPPESERAGNEGKPCNMRNGTRGAFMYDERGNFTCLRCCKQYHWSRKRHELHCTECGPCTRQDEYNVWKDCDPIKCETENVGPEQPSSSPTTSTSKSTTPSESTTPSTVIKENSAPTKLTPVMEPEPPKVAPTKLIVSDVSTTYAYVEWKRIPCNAANPVNHYQILLEDVELKKNTYYKTHGNETSFNLTSLRPQTCYNVKVQGVNSAGEGPFSDILDVHTRFELPHVKDVSVSNEYNTVTIIWKPQFKLTLQLTATYARLKKGKFVQDGSNEMKNCTQDHEGKLSFQLPAKGRYGIRVYYMEQLRPGPMSDMYKVEWKEGMSTVHIIMTVIFGIPAILVNVLLVFSLLRELCS